MPARPDQGSDVPGDHRSSVSASAGRQLDPAGRPVCIRQADVASLFYDHSSHGRVPVSSLPYRVLWLPFFSRRPCAAS